MTDKVRFDLSRIAVAASFVMAFTSSLILCACPGWPAIGVGLAIAALWLRKGREPFGSTLALLFSLVMLGMHLWDTFSLPGSPSDQRQKAKEIARQRATTNKASAATTNYLWTGPTTVTNRSQ